MTFKKNSRGDGVMFGGIVSSNVIGPLKVDNG